MKNTLWIIIIVMLIVWGTFLWFAISYGEEVKSDPCSVCSKQMGERVVCMVIGNSPISREYYPNGTIEQGK